MNRKLYLFDFDGTLTKKDTLFDFLKSSFPSKYAKIYILFIPFFILSKLKFIEPGKVKEKFIGSFLKGKSFVEINNLAQLYFNKNYPNIIHPKADEYIKSINNYNDKFIVSASLDLWIKPFADYYGMGLICTNAEFDEHGFYTGIFASKNCNNDEKRYRIEKEIDLSLYDEVIVFGDTEGDKAMFSLSTKKYYRYFN